MKHNLNNIINNIKSNSNTIDKKLISKDIIINTFIRRNLKNTSFKKIIDFSTDWEEIEPIAYSGDIPYGYYKNLRITFPDISLNYLPCFNINFVFKFNSSGSSNRTFDSSFDLYDESNTFDKNIVTEVNDLDGTTERKDVTFDCSVLLNIYNPTEVQQPLIIPKFKMLIHFIPKAGLKILEKAEDLSLYEEDFIIGG